jgi:hypothetical protein
MFSRTHAEVWYHKTPSSSLCLKETCNNEMTGSTLVVDLNQQAPQMYGRGLATITPSEPTLRKISPRLCLQNLRQVQTTMLHNFVCMLH